MHWNKTFFLIAAIGWLLSLVVNFTAWIGHYDLVGAIPALGLLHIVIFIVWIPSIFTIGKLHQTTGRLHEFWLKVLAANRPPWLMLIAGLGFGFAIFTWFNLLNSAEGIPEFKNGEYVLMEHANIIRTITLEEYNQARADSTRGFSGHWIFFYGAAAAILYPFGKRYPKQPSIPPQAATPA